MKVKLTTSRVVAYASGLPGPCQQCGEVIDVPEDEARRLLAAGQAEPVEPARPARPAGSRETAAMAPAERRS